MKLYIVGDIHGEFSKLHTLIQKVLRDFNRSEDKFVFVGDYIDRGLDSYLVIDFLYKLSQDYSTVFLMGNHEQMFYDGLTGRALMETSLQNGADATIKSYAENQGEFYIPESHKKVLFSGNYFYETKSCIVVHAGLPPYEDDPEQCDYIDLIWIRENFYKAHKRWAKTIIFGHTPTFFIQTDKNSILFDDERNIIGIDTGACYGGVLSCLRWPDKKTYKA